ncbi:MAG: hypothetical protein DRQ42_05235 [Gammaproteobacteria bacterium]|nr:MAG: hypothetical protein DRQ42_05235 [Gammaproteobacteria bacterium]
MEFECTPEGFAGRVKQLREANDPDKFFTFFDGGWAGTKQGAFDKAESIFEGMMMPWAHKTPSTLGGTSLDIGYGGGGQVRAASYYFETAIGIDVHGEWEYVINSLDPPVTDNVITLLQGDGHTLKEIGDNEIDFVHSWTTFMHLRNMGVVQSYLKEIHRVLSPGGTAIIYFSRLRRSGRAWADWAKDIQLEKAFAKRKGKAEVNQITLMIGLKCFEDKAMQAGLWPLGRTASHGVAGLGGQHGVALIKEE